VFRPPVRRVRSGRFQLRLSEGERELLRGLPEQLNDLLDKEDPALRRLFPPAYQDDPERDAEYQRLMREDLVERRRAALETMARTVDAPDLSEEELSGWLGALNDFRLVLGTQLDVTEDDDPGIDTPEHALYHYLTYLEDSVVSALADW
jgi:Domain of unknown function (DUF2017)